MAKNKQVKTANKASTISFNPEKSKYFTPIIFVLLFISLIVLFYDFVASDDMLHGSDTIQAGIFFRSLLVDHVHEFGKVPQWNPYIFGGLPFVEAFHGDIFYPLSIMKYLMPVHRALGYVLIFHIFLAGLFMYFCARQFKLSKIASLMSTIGYMYAAYLIAMVSPGHDGKMFVTALFPLTMLFLDRGFNSNTFVKQLFNFSMMGLVIGFIIISPHVQMAYFSLWALAIYTIFKLVLIFKESKAITNLIRPGLLALYAVIIGLAFSAIQFYPGYIYTSDFSPRADTKSGWSWATSWSLHEEEAFSLLAPEFSGTMCPNDDYKKSSYYWGKNPFKDNSESVGIISIFLALLGLFFIRKKESYFFGGVALFALIYALGSTTPIFQIFYFLIPKVKSLRAPSMIMFLFSFSIALLAGMALQKIMDDGRNFKDIVLKRFNIILFGFPGLLLLFALLFSMNGKGMLNLWTSIFFSDASSTMVQQNFSKLDLAYINIPSIQSGFWISFLFTALAAACIWMYRSKKAGIMILCGMLALPVINGVRFNKRFIETYNHRPEWSSNQLTNFFKQDKEKYRVMNFVGSQGIREDYLPHFDIEVVVGYHGNQLRWYDHLLGGPNKLNQHKPEFLNLVGAKYLLLPGNQNLPPDYFGEKSLTQAANFGQLQIVKNDNAFDRAYLVDSFTVFPIVDAAGYNKVVSGEFDLQNVVILEETPELSYKNDTLSTDSAWISEYHTDSLVVKLDVLQNKILVLTDNYYDAWQVYLDGQKGKILRAYGSFRAVEIPAGTKEAVFKFESKRYAVGKTVTWLTSIYLLMVIGFYFVSGYMRKKKEMEV